MAYPDFKLGSLTRQFGLTIDATTDLFASVPTVALRPDFQAQLTRIGPLALRVSSSPSSSRHWWQFRKQK
jgi:hypothetical protein